jgi:hypothetical protein
MLMMWPFRPLSSPRAFVHSLTYLRQGPYDGSLVINSCLVNFNSFVGICCGTVALSCGAGRRVAWRGGAL